MTDSRSVDPGSNPGTSTFAVRRLSTVLALNQLLSGPGLMPRPAPIAAFHDLTEEFGH